MPPRAIKVWSVRLLLLLLALLGAAALALWLLLRGSLAQLDGTRTVPGLAASVSVARDALGVPLISGANRLDLAYGTGFVHAQDRYFQMDLLRRTGAGELAELFGARAIGVDKAHRLHRFRARADLQLQTMAPAEREFLERYASGVNDGLNALAVRPFEYGLLGLKPRAWSTADSLLVVWAMFFDLQGKQEARELARGWLRDHSDPAQIAFLLPESSQWDAPLDASEVAAPDAPIPPAPPAWWGGAGGAAPSRVAANEFVDAVGSNNWALGGSRTAHGAAIVSDDMHLGLQLPTTWYRLALQFPDAGGVLRRVVGVTLPGAPPLVVVGSNGHLAWGFTNSNGDYLDLVGLEADAAHPGQVRTAAGWETLASHTETILVKGAAAATMVVRESSLGPLREVDGRSYAVHWVAHAPGALNLEGKRLELALTVDEALAIAAASGIPAQNFVAGDALGNIGWTVAGYLPRRVQHGLASTFPLAAGGATASWEGRLAAADYPRVSNPASGQLSTANNRQLMGPGAALIGDGGFDLGARNRQIRDDLAALGAKADVKAVYAITQDDRALFIAPWRERALKVLDAAALAGRPLRAQFRQLLQDSWNGHASVDSVGYRMARNTMWAYYELLFGGANGELAGLGDKADMALVTSRWPVVVARLLDAQPPAWLPAAYPDWRALQLGAIDLVINEMTRDGRTLAAASWGQRNTAAIAHPISGAVPLLQKWLSAPADMLPGDANMPRVAGPKFGQSQRMTVEPGKEEQGIFNMPGGQSGHPLSPFFLAGHADWVQGRATPLLPGPARHTLTFVP